MFYTYYKNSYLIHEFFKLIKLQQVNKNDALRLDKVYR